MTMLILGIISCHLSKVILLSETFVRWNICPRLYCCQKHLSDETFVQGYTVVRNICPMKHLCKVILLSETFVRWNICPRLYCCQKHLSDETLPRTSSYYQCAVSVTSNSFRLNSEHRYILLTKTTAVQNKVALSYHRVRGLYFLAIVFAATIVVYSYIIHMFEFIVYMLLYSLSKHIVLTIINGTLGDPRTNI